MADLAALIEARFGLATEAGRDMEADGVLAQILGRRSFRKYTDEPVPEYMRAILLAAFGGNAGGMKKRGRDPTS